MTEIPSLGARGEGWVVLQFALMAVVVATGVVARPWPEAVAGALSVLGAVLALAGVILAVASSRTLGRSLTPFPLPSDGGRLVEHGPYSVVRHPIYSAGILFFAGLSLAFSPLALTATAALALVWALKARVEERFLSAAYPAYGEYAAAVRYRLVPFVY